MEMQLDSKTIFKPSQIDDLLNKDYKFIKNNKKIEYMNIPIAFDIETTSFYNASGEKQATMYAWVFGINGKCIIGRTWDEFLLILKRIKDFYSLNINKRIIIWVHNLSFEFAFIQHLFKWDNVFAVDDRKPVYATTNDGLEFRCSYILSGYSLDMLSKNLTTYKINKLVGDLDYSKLRHSKTPLTDKEYQYILHDGLVVMAYIKELLDQYGDMNKLPLTQTGFVRKYVRTECLYSGYTSHKKKFVYKHYKKYNSLMNTLTIPNYKAYQQMKRVYTGGFTHCNSLYSGLIIDDVTSFDFTSSYPYVMVSELYPMSKPKLIQLHSQDEFNKYLISHCCMFEITFYNIKPKIIYDHPISASKCFNIDNVVEDNGRVVTADRLSISINEVDFRIIKDFYEWDYCDVWNFRIMEKGYLPTPFVKAILKLYELKTTLKGSTDSDDLQRYLNAKQQLNASYGMAVTDILQLNRTFKDGCWINEEPDIEEVFNKYNKAKNRFLYYPWGLWVTSYARKNLFMGIKAFGRDYIYADTDSAKIRNASNHINWINKYNDMVRKKLTDAMKWHRLDFSMVEPQTIKGEKKLIGVWDYDGHYKRFKTLGAKRYMYEDDENQMHITCSGVKKSSINYLKRLANNDNTKVFNLFKDDLYIPKEETGKNIHTYIDYEMKGYLTDYLGNTSKYHELSGVHLEGAEYTLSLSTNYIKYLSGIQQLI